MLTQNFNSRSADPMAMRTEVPDRPRDAESVDSMLDCLRGLLEEHGRLLAELRERITPVLKPHPVSGETDRPPQNQTACHLACAINEQSLFVAQMNRNVRDMLESVGL